MPAQTAVNASLLNAVCCDKIFLSGELVKSNLSNMICDHRSD
jgi:hypothetical protein